MTRGTEVGDAPKADCAPPEPRERWYPDLPLVSVIVVNFNYGRFLAEAVGSVFAQTYPRVECLVVDNASTDESGDVLAACAARYPGLRVLRENTNIGQTAACLDGFRQTRGPYVIFLDADDFLLPHCVATHVAVHLSSRVHAGFTSGEMLQMVDGQTVLSTNEAACSFRAKRKAQHQDLLRPTAAALGELRDIAEGMADRVVTVPRDESFWVWAPTSGNCFRRDALNLLCDGADLGRLMSQTDLYLATAVNAVTGSILIDEPLFAYRLHGGNVFSNRPQLQGLLHFDVRRTSGQAVLARRLVIDQLVGFVDRFIQEPWMRRSFWKTLKRIDSRVEEPGPWHNGSYAARAVARNFDAVAAEAGRLATAVFLLERAPWRLKPAILLRLGPAGL